MVFSKDEPYYFNQALHIDTFFKKGGCKMEQEKLCLSAYELSLKTGLSLSFIRKLTREDKIPYLRVGRRILYPITGVEKWLANDIDADTDEQ